MVFLRVASKILTGVIFAFAIAACEQPAGDSEGNTPAPEKKPTLLSANIVPVYSGATTSYLRVSLNCRSYSVIEFTYQSLPLNPKKTVWKNCGGSSVTQNLSVIDGTTQQLFQIKVMGYMEQPAVPINLPWNLTANFNPNGGATSVASGKGITSGGGPITGTGIKIINSSVGEVFVGSTSASGAIDGTARNGLQGTIDP